MSEGKTNVAAVVHEKARETKIKRKKKKIGNEIDEIFQGKKRKIVPADDQKAKDRGKTLDKVIGESGSSKTKDKKKRRKVDLNEDSGTAGRRRRTADGLAIYSADELGWGKADVGGLEEECNQVHVDHYLQDSNLDTVFRCAGCSESFMREQGEFLS